MEEFPSMIELIEKSQGRIALLAVSLDTDKQQMDEFLKNYKIKQDNIYVVWDPKYEVANKYGTYKLPESFIIGKERKLLKKIVGTMDWIAPEVLSWFDSQN